MSAEEFKRRRDIIEKGLDPNAGLLEQNMLKKRKPTDTNLQTLIKKKNVGQMSFADEEDMIVLPKKEKKPEEPKKVEEPPVEAPIAKAPKQKVNLLEEDEETKRQKQEALEVLYYDLAYSKILGWLRSHQNSENQEGDQDRSIPRDLQKRLSGGIP